MDLLKPTNCQGHLLVPNNFCVFALNTRVIQLLDIVIEVNTASAGDLVKQYSRKSREIVETWLQNLKFIVIFRVK